MGTVQKEEAYPVGALESRETVRALLSRETISPSGLSIGKIFPVTSNKFFYFLMNMNNLYFQQGNQTQFGFYF